MVEAVSIFFIVAGIVLAVWWAFADQPQKPAGFAASALAVLAGLAMLLRGEIVAFSVDDIETIEAAAARASQDAEAIRDLRASVEVEAKAAEGRVAAYAAETRRLAAETRTALAKAEKAEQRASERSRQIERSAALPRPEAAAAPTETPAAAGDPSVNQLAVLATSLRGSGSHEVTLTTSMNDPEAIALAARLKAAIEAGGWIVHGVNETQLEPPVSGLQVLSPVPMPAHFATLLGALGRAGLQPKGMARPRADKLEVLVGSKPGPS